MPTRFLQTEHSLPSPTTKGWYCTVPLQVSGYSPLRIWRRLVLLNFRQTAECWPLAIGTAQQRCGVSRHAHEFLKRPDIRMQLQALHSLPMENTSPAPVGMVQSKSGT